MEYVKMNSEQIRNLTNATQLFEALERLRQNEGRFRGSMHYKHIKGRDYLYRAYSGGRNQSLGPKSSRTEEIKKNFEQGKSAHNREKKTLTRRIRLHAAYIKANGLNRFPGSGARIVRAFQKAKIPHRVIGTSALFVYEISAGVLFMPQHLATEDMDVLLDSRQSLRIAANLKNRTLMSLIRDTDSSFKRLSDSPYEFAATNDEGFMVELITKGRRDIMTPGAFNDRLQGSDLHPIEIDSLKWHLASPHYSEVVFDHQGMPLRVDTVDPRAFVLHKWYVSRREDRKPAKRHRDGVHARLVAQVVVNELRHLPGTGVIQRLFPDDVVRQSPDTVDEFSL